MAAGPDDRRPGRMVDRGRSQALLTALQGGRQAGAGFGTGSPRGRSPMRRHLVGAAELFIVASLATGALYFHGGVSNQDLLRAYILFCCSVAAFLLVQLARHSGDPAVPRERKPRAQQAVDVPGELLSVADALRAGRASRPDFDRSVRPWIRELAVDRLSLVGIDPRHDPKRASDLIGPELMEVAFSSGPSQARVQDRGPSPAQLGAWLDRLEGLGG